MKPTSTLAAVMSLCGTAALATEFSFTFPIKSGPLLGTIATGTIDLEDGVFTGQGTEVFMAPGSPNPSAGDIVDFEVNVSTLTFTDEDNLLGPTDLMIVFNKGIVTQFIEGVPAAQGACGMAADRYNTPARRGGRVVEGARLERV